ncbi:hypothetical protein BDQ12DRAFT_737847 [Crucibulum laeve]|uniref:Uncharacterized protein n=1 Tax=Crucibulum laeve TaxID=68775 RepID=A0A5C3LQ95_9AGAR|nr:hypothetical protein BDQ12DRAFT_737847 [Crucibulum laeve]
MSSFNNSSETGLPKPTSLQQQPAGEWASQTIDALGDHKTTSTLPSSGYPSTTTHNAPLASTHPTNQQSPLSSNAPTTSTTHQEPLSSQISSSISNSVHPNTKVAADSANPLGSTPFVTEHPNPEFANPRDVGADIATAANAVKNAVGAAAGMIPTSTEDIKNAANAAGSTTVNVASNAAAVVGSTAQQAASTIGATAQQAASTIGAHASQAGSAASNTAQQAASTIGGTASQAGNVASNTAGNAASTARGTAGEAGNVAGSYAASAGNVASNVAATAGNVASNAAATLGAYVPESVKSYLPGTTTNNTTSLPTTETSSNTHPYTVGGVGTLPGSNDESGVAKLPEERHSTTSHTGSHTGGVGDLPGSNSEASVAKLPEERNLESSAHTTTSSSTHGSTLPATNPFSDIHASQGSAFGDAKAFGGNTSTTFGDSKPPTAFGDATDIKPAPGPGSAQTSSTLVANAALLDAAADKSRSFN